MIGLQAFELDALSTVVLHATLLPSLVLAVAGFGVGYLCRWAVEL